MEPHKPLPLNNLVYTATISGKSCTCLEYSVEWQLVAIHILEFWNLSYSYIYCGVVGERTADGVGLRGVDGVSYISSSQLPM